jgi:DNA-directed RNA polymerase subunit beta
MSVKIDGKRKIPVTALLRAFGYGSDKELKELFSDVDTGELKFIDETISKDPSSFRTAERFNRRYIEESDLVIWLPVEDSKSLIDSMFSDYKRDDFSKVGRYKVNKRLGLNVKILQKIEYCVAKTL